MVAVAGAFLFLSSSLLPQSRVLRLRGGSAAPVPSPAAASQEAQPEWPLRLQLVAGSDTAVVRLPSVEVSSANIAAMQLPPGARVRVHRAHKRTDKPAWRPANPFQRPIPDDTLAVLREAEAPTPRQPYALGDGEARLPSKAMQAMRLQAGDTVLVTPGLSKRKLTTRVVRDADQATRIQRRRRGSFLNNVIMFNYMMGGGYGGGYGYGPRRSAYGYRGSGRGSRRVRSSYSGRRSSYGGRRRY